MNVNEGIALLATLAAKAKDIDEKLYQMYDNVHKLVAHVDSIIKSRNFSITGDTSHLGIGHIISRAAKIDEPKKYAFQSDTVNEDKFIRDIMAMLIA